MARSVRPPRRKPVVGGICPEASFGGGRSRRSRAGSAFRARRGLALRAELEAARSADRTLSQAAAEIQSANAKTRSEGTFLGTSTRPCARPVTGRLNEARGVALLPEIDRALHADSDLEHLRAQLSERADKAQLAVQDLESRRTRKRPGR